MPRFSRALPAAPCPPDLASALTAPTARPTGPRPWPTPWSSGPDWQGGRTSPPPRTSASLRACGRRVRFAPRAVPPGPGATWALSGARTGRGPSGTGSGLAPPAGGPGCCFSRGRAPWKKAWPLEGFQTWPGDCRGLDLGSSRGRRRSNQPNQRPW